MITIIKITLSKCFSSKFLYENIVYAIKYTQHQYVDFKNVINLLPSTDGCMRAQKTIYTEKNATIVPTLAFFPVAKLQTPQKAITSMHSVGKNRMIPACTIGVDANVKYIMNSKIKNFLKLLIIFIIQNHFHILVFYCRDYQIPYT